MVKIVTDSTTEISPERAKELGIEVVPIWVNFGSESYRERIDITTDEFYRRLEAGEFPTTGASPAGAFAEVYDRLAEETDEVLAVMLSPKLSATYESALRGVSLMKNTRCHVEVVHDNQTTGSHGLLVMAANEAAQQGATMEELKELVQELDKKAHVRLTFDTMEYLKRGGRIGGAQAFLGSILHFHPVIGVINGVVDGVARVRSRKQALDWLVNFASGFNNVSKMAVEYATTKEEARELVQRLGSIFSIDRIEQFTIGPVIGTHLGPHTIGVALIE